MITLHGSFDEVAQPEVDGSASSAPSGPREVQGIIQGQSTRGSRKQEEL